DIKSRIGDFEPSAVVIVATVRALKMHGGVAKDNLKEENVAALEAGMDNLKKHIETVQHFNLPFVVAINKFTTDTEAETIFIEDWCDCRGYSVALTDSCEKGGGGGIDLAEKVVKATEEKQGTVTRIYDLENSLETKIRKVAQNAYGAD